MVGRGPHIGCPFGAHNQTECNQQVLSCVPKGDWQSTQSVQRGIKDVCVEKIHLWIEQLVGSVKGGWRIHVQLTIMMGASAQSGHHEETELLHQVLQDVFDVREVLVLGQSDFGSVDAARSGIP